jgi:hypothetical protein
MGLFGDLDVASAEDDPFSVPANTYEATVYEVEVKPTQDGSKTGLNIVYKIASGEHEGKSVREWKQIPKGAITPEDKRAASFLKMRLASLGVPESRMNDIDVNDLQGLDVIINVKVNGEYTNVTRVELADASTPAGGSAFSGFGG